MNSTDLLRFGAENILESRDTLKNTQSDSFLSSGTTRTSRS